MRFLLFFILAFNTFGEVSSQFRGQYKSLVDWQGLDATQWLDLKDWKEDREFKDRYPYWETLKRIERHVESIGRVLECVGDCRLYRDGSQYKLQYLSEIFEADEIKTEKDSYMWIYLIDGGMVRLAPNSSISFKEINILKDKIFFHARVNLGNVLWMSRSQSKYEVKNQRQTDTLFIPLSLYEANPITRDRKLTMEEYLFEDTSLYDRPYNELNELIEKNNQTKIKDTEIFLVLPNANIYGKNLTVESYVGIGQSNYFKVRNDSDVGLIESQEKAFQYNLRGFANTEIFTGNPGSWYEIALPARSAQEIEAPREFLLNEILTKRIPSILIAREMLFEKYSKIVIETTDINELAKKYGYRSWSEEELVKRVEFLWFFMRRLETSNLVVASRYREKIMDKYELRDSEVINPEFYKKAFAKYIKDGEIGRERIFIPKLNSEKKELWKKRLGIRTDSVTMESLLKEYYEEIKASTSVK